MKIRQVSVDLYDCGFDLLDSQKVVNILKVSVERLKANVIKEISYEFQPHGLSLILFLSESHISFYTWPEYQYAICEIFLCNDKMDPNIVVADVVRKFMAKRHKVHSHEHFLPVS